MSLELQQSVVAKTLKHSMVFVLVLLWTLPTLGLLVSSVRDKDQLSSTGWWSALTSTTQADVHRLPKANEQVFNNGLYEIRSQLFDADNNSVVGTWGPRADELENNKPDQPTEFGDNSTITVASDGTIVWTSEEAFTHTRGPRVFYSAKSPPRFTFDNYREVLQSEGVGRAFINTFTVTLPATFIPILIAAFAAYALAWMEFKGRFVFLAMIIGLIVVPLQMSLIPVLQVFAAIGRTFDVPSKSYVTIWLAHTGFGLPLAIFLLRNYMASLPRDIIESAYMDGATHFQIFMKMILPLSMPALASFAIFQFLWTWNDLLVAAVFLGQGEDKTVMTQQLIELLGSRGDNWEILTSGAFISIVVPIIIFLSMQRYFVRGLLAGSVKGG
ncbi:carbohydrate ABC transporter permease [Reinekea marina]|uniref:Carbohydrate ABC transporter permease n=1 Tax=Reinekea marina TaxID=1310421 RepID=A0ABV7WUF8_9GAMM|nr:carbohydrate ABC transporter permease [Reinekea marina]MDN3647979.1 carbohydrate ABC transporter permease [Reinekea marina]